MSQEVVYVIGTPGSNTVKIGRTIDLPKRLRDIQRMSPVPLLVLWTHPGGHELETNLHRHFKEIRSHGEWFAFAVDPLELIQAAVSERPWGAEPAPTRRTYIDLKPRQLPLTPAFDFPEIATAMVEVFAEIGAIEDPVQAFRTVRQRRAEIAAVDNDVMNHQRNLVRQLHDEGRSWRAVGDLIDVSGARAQAIAAGRRSAA